MIQVDEQLHFANCSYFLTVFESLRTVCWNLQCGDRADIIIHNHTRTKKCTCSHTHPNTFKHTVENEIQVLAGVFIFFCSLQGLWGVEKVKTRLREQTHTHILRHEQIKGDL